MINQLKWLILMQEINIFSLGINIPMNSQRTTICSIRESIDLGS